MTNCRNDNDWRQKKVAGFFPTLGPQTAAWGVELAKISCASGDAATRSQRDEHVRAFKKPWTHVYRDLRLRGIHLGTRAECFTAVAPARPRRRESGRAQLCSYGDRVRCLRRRWRSAASQRTAPSRSIFRNLGVDVPMGRIAFSQGAHLRERAARARLARSL